MSLLEDVRIYEAYERILEREEINEILQLKPAAAKEAAKKKLQQISDDIKRAISKFGEDSKTVLYLRAKKKRMQQQLAHAMGEEKKECPDGHEWDEKMQECLPSSTGIKEQQAEECPDGQEWSEDVQDCVAVEMKEQRKLSQKEWDTFKKKGETSEKNGKKFINMKYKGGNIPVPVVIVEKTFSIGSGDEKKLVKLLMQMYNMDKTKAQNYVKELSAKAQKVILPEERDCPEGMQWCPIQKKCVEPGQGMKEELSEQGSKAIRAAKDILSLDGFKCARKGMTKDVKLSLEGHIARIIEREMK